jgi:hypothetical protein
MSGGEMKSVAQQAQAHTVVVQLPSTTSATAQSLHIHLLAASFEVHCIIARYWALQVLMGDGLMSATDTQLLTQSGSAHASAV